MSKAGRGPGKTGLDGGGTGDDGSYFCSISCFPEFELELEVMVKFSFACCRDKDASWELELDLELTVPSTLLRSWCRLPI
jgi:hypothetical protein